MVTADTRLCPTGKLYTDLGAHVGICACCWQVLHTWKILFGALWLIILLEGTDRILISVRTKSGKLFQAQTFLFISL